MSKFILSSSLILTLCITACSQLPSTNQLTTTNVVSLVDPNIERLALPPTPNNMKLPEFGQGIIGWGTGPEGAQARLNNLQKTDVEKFKNQGVTLEMLQTWQAFYENETRRNAGNPTAPLRAQLMKNIIALW